MLSAQQPAYFTLGENQLKGVKVFDIIQDFEKSYYFATNEGILKYDFINYTKLNVKEAKSVSFFNFTINKHGTIYFNNLNNQIFEIKNGVCNLFYELPSEVSANLIHLTTDNSGHLIIGSKGLIVLDTAANIVLKYKHSNTINTSFHLNSVTIIFPIAVTNKVLLYSQGEIREQSLFIQDPKLQKFELLQFFRLKDTLYALDLGTKITYLCNEKRWTLIPLEIGNIFNATTNARVFITDNNIWSPSSSSGTNFCKNKLGNPYQIFYEDCFISDIYKDKEGNVLLGTFEKGILVIPDENIPDVINSFSADPAISVFAKDSVVYLGSNRGFIYAYRNNALHTISGLKTKPVEGIYGSPLSQYLIYDDEKIKCYNTLNGEVFSFSGASLKDVAFVSANQVYLGTNIGILKVHFLPNKKFTTTNIQSVNFRIYSLAYNHQNSMLYSSSANGLNAINKNGVATKIKHNNKDIFPEKLYCNNGILYAVTREWGLLTIQPNLKISKIETQFTNKDESIKQFTIYQNTMIVNTAYGLYQMSLEGKILRQFHSDYGFTTKKIYSFSIAQNQLWVSHSGGVQKIDLLYKKQENWLPQINIKSLKVNNEDIKYLTKNTFKADERKFDFTLYSPTLKHIQNIKYYYQLKGYDEKWQVLNTGFNTITFNALSPGDYTLAIKAENLGVFSPQKTYSFTIKSPIYAQPWFIITAVGLFLGIVYFIYKRQLGIQKQKSRQINELNQSKLTAIQSQMNPHFIFNSLNTIQDLVLQQNATKAYDSIGKFAILIRKIMHHSEKEFIDIEEELSILNVYLEMEMLRIKTNFSYTINSNNIADIEIPPMLIQPFIENALKHGLMHKEGEKKLILNMRIEDNLFICEITDNGIGRKRSNEIKERQNKLYESFSGTTLDKRLFILKKHFGGNFGVQILDLYDNENKASGTKVILNAPFKYKF